MAQFWPHLRRSFARVIPACLTQAQAVAFNMFLALFPVLLLGLGVLTSSAWMTGAAGELPRMLEATLPPGSGRLLNQFLQHLDTHPWKLIALGLGGTLLIGTQVMMGLMEGFRNAGGDCERPGFWNRYLRAVALLCITIVPWLATVTLSVFAKQTRDRIIHEVGEPVLIRALWVLLYYTGTLLVGLLVLVVMYRVARPLCRQWREVVPGAVVATVLWLVLNGGFAFYFRHMPYSLVYGSLAAVIGLMVWMYFTALVVIVGSAYNAEASAKIAPQARAAEPAPEIIGPIGPRTGTPGAAQRGRAAGR